jgi:hypothetical protein
MQFYYGAGIFAGAGRKLNFRNARKLSAPWLLELKEKEYSLYSTSQAYVCDFLYSPRDMQKRKIRIS